METKFSELSLSNTTTAGKPIKCRAAIVRAAGEPLVIEEVIVATPKAREARIRIICTSLCFSDVTFWKLTVPPACFPRILGHEAVGVVESVGEDVKDLTVGDTVIPVFLPDCGECVDCKSDKSNLCSDFLFHVSDSMPRDKTSRFTDLKGETIHHFLWVSSFSEYTVVDIANLTKIDPSIIPPNRACLFSCGVSTGVGAAWRTAKVEAGSTVAIIGLGSIGLAVAEGARLCGAKRIIGIDINPDKFETAKAFGVTDFVNSRECGDKSLSQVIIELTNGGADYCFECVGSSLLVQEAYAASRKGWGKTVVVGVDKPGSELHFSSFDVLHLGKTLMGSLFGGLKPKTDIPILIKRYLDKELELDKFVTHELMFEDINKAFELLIQGKPIKCRAAIARAAGEPLVIEEVIVAPPKAREVRIRIVCTSLCFSDVTFWKLNVPPACFPRILGHEAVGVVESVGEDVKELTVGDTVIPVFIPDCGECIDCKSDKSNLCSNFPFHVLDSMPRDKTSRFTDLKGETIHHFVSVSSFSEYTVIDIANLTKIHDPSIIPPNRACLFSCGVSTGVGAAWRTAKVEPGSSVAIFGLGSIGLAVAEGARLCGAARIIGIDINPDKFETAKKFGVTDFVNSRECGDKSLSQVIIDLTNGGADYCFECVGSSSVVQEAYASCRKGWGKTVVLGVDKPGTELNLSSFEVVHMGKTLMGSVFGGLKPKSDIPILIKRYFDKELELDKFVTHELKFEDINKAFELLIQGKSLRCVIWMDQTEKSTQE